MEKEFIDSLNKWVLHLIAAFGGISAIATGIIILATKLANQKLVHNWRLSSSKELEALKGEISKNNSVLNSLTQQKSQSFQKLVDKRIVASEVYWTGILEMRNSIPPIVSLCYEVLKDDELKRERLDKSPSTLGSSIAKASMEEVSKITHEVFERISQCRPFISESLWLLMYVYRIFVGRSTHLLIDGYKNGDIKIWKHETATKQILLAVLSKEEFEYVLSRGPHSYKSMFEILENKMLQEIKRITLGEDLTMDSLAELKKISRILELEE